MKGDLHDEKDGEEGRGGGRLNGTEEDTYERDDGGESPTMDEERDGDEGQRGGRLNGMVGEKSAMGSGQPRSHDGQHEAAGAKERELLQETVGTGTERATT